VQDYLHGTRQQKLSLAALAHRFGLDKYKLIRLFSRFTGATPNKYLTILRVEQAKRLLAAGQPLVEVVLSWFLRPEPLLALFLGLHRLDAGQLPS
jgi:transcriptional regulator GlxA family with amidase domain